MKMKGWKILVIGTVVATLPVSQAFAVVAGMEIVFDEGSPSWSIEERNWGGLELTTLVAQEELPKIDPGMASLFFQDETIASDLNEIEALVLTGEEEEEELILAGAGFWTKGKVLITTGILLFGGLLLAILGLAAGGSGGGTSIGISSGPGSGDNSSGDGNASGGPSSVFSSSGDISENSGNTSNAGDSDGSTGFVGGGAGTTPGFPGTSSDGFSSSSSLGGGSGGIGGGGSGTNGSSIPHSPEPATVLLMGFGLLVPFLRRRGL